MTGHFAITEIGVVGLKRAGFNAPDDPLGIENNLSFLPDILAVQALTGLLVGINLKGEIRGQRRSGRTGRTSSSSLYAIIFCSLT